MVSPGFLFFMTKGIFESNNEIETFEFAKKFAADLRGGEVIGLSGDLGAGKTIFTKGIGAGLSVVQNITSPTFVIMKVYPTSNNEKIKHLCHIDAYRITQNDLDSIGATEYLNREYTVTVIEWIENIQDVVKNIVIEINIKQIDTHKRVIQIK